jgi:hypothetical protein
LSIWFPERCEEKSIVGYVVPSKQLAIVAILGVTANRHMVRICDDMNEN